jgi:glycosyltransferase involved in cell wall biosynthesis
MPAPRLRVLQVINSLGLGGAENVLVKLALGVDPNRFETSVCCTSDLGPLVAPLTSHGVSVQLAGPRGRVHNYLRPWHIKKVISAIKPHVVHTHGLPALAEVGPGALLGRRHRWIHTYHYGNYPYTERRHHMALERWISALPDQLVAVSDRQRETIIRYHELDANRITTIHNGVQPNKAREDGCTRIKQRQALGIPPDALVIGSVSVLSEQKGLTYFLQAAEMIHQRMPDVRFLVVGGGPLEQSLRSEAADRGIGEVVHFTGWRKDVTDLLCAFDIWVMSSLWEAMPVALLEAMAARLPIVATDVGQNGSIVPDQVAGLIVPPRDPSAIASSVMELIEKPARAAELAQAAFCRVEKDFTTARMIERYEALYATAGART